MKTISYKNTHYIVYDIQNGDKFTLSPTHPSIGDDDTVEIKKQDALERKNQLFLDKIISYDPIHNKEKIDFLCRILKDKKIIIKLMTEYGLSLDEIVKLAYKGII